MLTTGSASTSYVHWRKRAREARKASTKPNFPQLLFSYQPAAAADAGSSSSSFIRQVSLQLDLEESQAEQLVAKVRKWTPPSDVSLGLLLDEYYADRLAGIELLVEQATAAASSSSSASLVDTLVRLVGAVFNNKAEMPLSGAKSTLPELQMKWTELRHREDLALVQGLAGLKLAKHTQPLFASFANFLAAAASTTTSTTTEQQLLVLMRAWYTALLPLTPPPRAPNAAAARSPYYAVFAEDDDDDDEEDDATWERWGQDAVHSLHAAFGSPALPRLNGVERRVLRNHVERALASDAALPSPLLLQGDNNNDEDDALAALFSELCALGFGKHEPFACDAFWAGQYPNLHAHFISASSTSSHAAVFLASTAFTKRQPRRDTVTLVSRDLAGSNVDELRRTRAAVVQSHARLLDMAPSRRPLQTEELTMGGILLRYLLSSSSSSSSKTGGGEWCMLVCDALDCLVTLCERNPTCRDMIVQCCPATSQLGEQNYLVQVLQEWTTTTSSGRLLLVQSYALELVKTVLERTTPQVASFRRDCARLAVQLGAIELTPVLGLVSSSSDNNDAAYLLERMAELACRAVLEQDKAGAAAAAAALVHLAQQKQPQLPVQARSQRFVLVLLRHLYEPDNQRLLRALLLEQQQQPASASWLLGLVGPSHLLAVCETLLDCMEDGEAELYALLLAVQQCEPELVVLLIQAHDKFLATLLGVTLHSENEQVLELACELVELVLARLSADAVDGTYFTSLVESYAALDADEHFKLKSRLLSILATPGGGALAAGDVLALAGTFPQRPQLVSPADDANYAAFVQAWSALLVALSQQQQQQGVDLSEVWEALCAQLVGHAAAAASSKITDAVIKLMVQTMPGVVKEQELEQLANRIGQEASKKDGAAAVNQLSNVFILACTRFTAPSSSSSALSRLRQQLLPVACDMVLQQSRPNALFLECCGEAQHALLPECFQCLLLQSAAAAAAGSQQQQQELLLRGLIRASKLHSVLLLSLGMVPKLLCAATTTTTSSTELLALKVTLMSALLENASSSSSSLVGGAIKLFFQTHSVAMQAQLGKFHSTSASVTISGLHLCRQVARLLRLAWPLQHHLGPQQSSSSSSSLDQMYQSCLALIRDLVLGGDASGALPPLLEEFADHLQCEERRSFANKPKRSSALVVRAVPETAQEIAWSKLPVPHNKARRSSSAGGGVGGGGSSHSLGEDTVGALQRQTSSSSMMSIASVDSPFRRSGNNLLGLFGSETAKSPFATSSSVAVTPGGNNNSTALALVAADGKQQPRMSAFHVRVEQEIELVLLELLLLFLPLLQQNMLVFQLTPSSSLSSSSSSADIATLLSLLRWLSRSSAAPVLSVNKSRLAGIAAVSLLHALKLALQPGAGSTTRAAGTSSSPSAKEIAQKHLVEKRLLSSVARKLSPTNAKLVEDVETAVHALFL